MLRENRKIVEGLFDKLWSYAIKARVGFRCELYKTDHIQCSFLMNAMHVVSRGSSKRLHWDLKNGVCGCTAHHKFYTHKSEVWLIFAAKKWPKLWKYLQEYKWSPGEKIDHLQTFKTLTTEVEKYLEPNTGSHENLAVRPIIMKKKEWERIITHG